MSDYDDIDFSDIPEITDVSGYEVRRNPYYESLMKNGFTISVRYTPEDAAKIAEGIRAGKSFRDIVDADEKEAFEAYRKKLTKA